MSNAQHGNMVDPETCFYLLERTDKLDAVVMLHHPGQLSFDIVIRHAKAAI
jgi:hypothetical protein